MTGGWGPGSYAGPRPAGIAGAMRILPPAIPTPGCTTSDCFIRPVISISDFSFALIWSRIFLSPCRRCWVPYSMPARPSWCSVFRSPVHTRPRAQPEIDNRAESFGTGFSCAETQLNDAATTFVNPARCFMPQAYRHRGDPCQRIEFGWPRSARAHTGGQRAVLEFLAAGGAAQ